MDTSRPRARHLLNKKKNGVMYVMSTRSEGGLPAVNTPTKSPFLVKTVAPESPHAENGLLFAPNTGNSRDRTDLLSTKSLTTEVRMLVVPTVIPLVAPLMMTAIGSSISSLKERKVFVARR